MYRDCECCYPTEVLHGNHDVNPALIFQDHTARLYLLQLSKCNAASTIVGRKCSHEGTVPVDWERNLHIYDMAYTREWNRSVPWVRCSFRMWRYIRESFYQTLYKELGPAFTDKHPITRNDTDWIISRHHSYSPDFISWCYAVLCRKTTHQRRLWWNRRRIQWVVTAQPRLSR